VNDVARIRNGLNIRRPKKKSMLTYKTNPSNRVFHDLTALHSAYNRLQFLLAVSLSIGVHAGALHQTQTVNAAAAAMAARTRKLRRQQRLCDFNGSGADEVTSSAPEPILGFLDISI